MTGTAVRGFDKESMVKATKTLRVYDSTGNRIKIRAESIGMADSSAVDEDGHQHIHFEVGSTTPCVRFPVEALQSA